MDQVALGADEPVGESDEGGVWCTDVAARIRGGDAGAESELVSRFQPGLLMILRRACGGDIDQARDLCQDTLLIVLRRLRELGIEDPSRLAAFAAQTARNLAIAARRKDGRRRTQPDTEATTLVADEARQAGEQVEDAASAFAVRKVLQEMKGARDRDVLMRFYLQDEDKDSICRDLQLTDLLFNQVLFRARNRFRELLESKGHVKSDLLSVVLL